MRRIVEELWLLKETVSSIKNISTSSSTSSRNKIPMDSISSFDIVLEKDVYHAGETINGTVIIENFEPIKIKDRHDSDELEIFPIGLHQLPFHFQLPVCQLPCSLETKTGSIRYHIKALIDIPHASSPQGMKYFTIIGPHIDCNEEKYTTPLSGQDHKVQCFRCCKRGIVALRVVLDRTAYCCGENLRLRAHIENHQENRVCLYARLNQNIEYRIERGNYLETKLITSTALEYRSPIVPENCQSKFDYCSDPSLPPIKIPIIPPTMIGVCRLLQVYYVLKIYLEDERKNQSLELNFPLTIGTHPYHLKGLSNSALNSLNYDYCVDYVETGKYISPEFRLGQVYDGGIEGSTERDVSDVILYRPVYARIPDN